MSDVTDSPKLDSCGCCEQDAPTPELFNRPGLPELAYRIGTHPTFLQRMLAQLPRWMKIFTRKRASPGRPNEMSQEPCSRNMLMACLLSPMRSEAMRRVSSAVSNRRPGPSTGMSCP